MAPSNVIQGSFPHGLPRFAAEQNAAPHSVRAGAVQPRVAGPPANPRIGPPANPRAVPLPSPIAQPKLAPAAQLRANGTATQLPRNLARFPAGGGRPLPAAVLQKMESFFRTSFSDVRVHVGPHVSTIGAVAFTQGSNIHFAPGHYDPWTARGQQILGRELTHVVQQRSGRVTNPFGSGIAVVHNHAMDHEAERMGQRAAAAFRAPAIQRRKLSDGGIERDILDVAEAKKNDLSAARPVDRPGVLRDFVYEYWANNFEIDITTLPRNRKAKLKTDNAIDEDDADYMWEHVARYVAAARVDAARALVDAKAAASDVTITHKGIEVYLDVDQLKHQPVAHPIGTRAVGGGNKFRSINASKVWHKANTLVHMGQWAESLVRIYDGEKLYHGQATPVGGIHYEGFCLAVAGKKYVFFHCYPSDSSPLKQ